LEAEIHQMWLCGKVLQGWGNNQEGFTFRNQKGGVVGKEESRGQKPRIPKIDASVPKQTFQICRWVEGIQGPTLLREGNGGKERNSVRLTVM